LIGTQYHYHCHLHERDLVEQEGHMVDVQRRTVIECFPWEVVGRQLRWVGTPIVGILLLLYRVKMELMRTFEIW